MAQQSRRAVRIKALVSGLLLAVSLVTLTVSTRSLEGVPERVGLAVVSFVQRGFDSVSGFFSRTATSIAELRRLQESHRELLAQVEALTNQQRDYSVLKGENERLKEQLAFSQASGYQAQAARIVARDPENLYATFVIDKGTAHGVRKNQAVVAYQNGIEGLVGKVLEASRLTSVVVPVYDATTYVAARLERSRYEGLAVGSGSDDLPLVMKYVKKRAKDEIQYGDLVVTSGLQSLYPQGIAVGRVTKLRIFDYLTSLEIELEPVLDFGRIEYVFVVLGQGAEGGAE
ncbi:MAG: rod shape-determining protein MreC [Spirochaetales bacterium]|nr:rod shape-determining protein MreC [Spirochaetales bacterium]